MADPRREGTGARREDPLLARLSPVALFVVIAATIAVSTLSVLSLGDATEAQERLLEAEVAALRGALERDRVAVPPDADGLAEGKRRAAAVARTATRALLLAAGVALVLAIAMAAVARRSLRALAKSEARYRGTFERAAIGIAHVAPDGRWLRANPRFQEIVGYSEPELRLRTSEGVTHPEDVAGERALAGRLLRGELEVYSLEKRYVRKDGSYTWVQLTVAPVRDATDRLRYLVAAAEAIDQRKHAEEDLREAVRARDEFLHIASHELRTPLTSLRLQLESLRGALGRAEVLPRERLHAKAESALRASERLGTLVDELLDVSRIAEGAVVVAPEEGDLVAAVREVAERMAPDAARAGSEVHVLAPEALRARFDPARLEQALTHLVANALKYGAGKPVDLVVQRQGAAARLLVRDRGIGIDPAERERIFGRFERAVSSRHYGGLGLGLFVARRLVEAHGGTIAVDSSPGEGSTFAIELPLAGPPLDLARAASRSA
jgi:PAS domain S-box-containing protein